MKRCLRITFTLLLFSGFIVQAQKCADARWTVTGDGIRWNMTNDRNLPHGDNIEMSGRLISAILHYTVDTNRELSISRELFWPSLRRKLQPGEPEWMRFRAYFSKCTDSIAVPLVLVNNIPVKAGPVRRIELEEYLKVEYESTSQLKISRALFPSVHQPLFLEQWTFENCSGNELKLEVKPLHTVFSESGELSMISWGTYLAGIPERTLAKGEKISFYLLSYAYAGEKTAIESIDGTMEKKNRKEFVDEISGALILNTPDETLNMAFRMAKIRTSESLFETRQGLVHSPGGGRYYGGVWANDQVEYAGPFFPYLGYKAANDASLNAYRIFARDMKSDYSPIWSSHEMEGDYPCCGKDRGDAAMYAYGASRFALALGDKAIAEELWPAISWCIEYIRRHTTAEGVIASATDEMEGRIATGSANLSTSTLAYGGLRTAAILATSIGKTDTAALFNQRADELLLAIERYFGADIEGYHTYRYFDGHEKLRHWMGLPLTMGIYTRADGVKNALFGKLWTSNGLNVEDGEEMFWDRGTLYALRGLFNAGFTGETLEKLKAYSCQRLLGEHVPYPVEAWPEGNQAQLAAESALYCRIFTEGLFGLVPTGLSSLECTPRLPSGWDKMELKKVKLQGESINLSVERKKGELLLTVSSDKRVLIEKNYRDGETIQFHY